MSRNFCEKCGKYYNIRHKCTRENRPGNPYKPPTEKKVTVTFMVSAENKRYLQERARKWDCTLSEVGNRLIDAHRAGGLRIEKREQALKDWENGL